jgi:tRNA dimethylallyltransferase
MDTRRTKTKIIVVVGPTASGKTRLGIDLARRFDGEVVSVDSRLVYKGMDVGTAKPNGEWIEAPIERGSISQLFGTRRTFLVDGVPHWGIDLVESDEEYNVADFKKYADAKIAEIAGRGRLPILVGGTGLWVRAVVDDLNLTETPPNPELRARLEARHLDDLYAEYKRLDPDGAEAIDRDNRRRVVRALEVTLATGRPFSAQLRRGAGKHDALQIGIAVGREELNARIDARVDEMVANGLVSEVRRLRDAYGCDGEAMTGIGYRQICRWMDAGMGSEGRGPRRPEREGGDSPDRARTMGWPVARGPMPARFDITLADAIEETKKATRAYAKRQMTWFRRDDRIHWVSGLDEAVKIIEEYTGFIAK